MNRSPARCTYRIGRSVTAARIDSISFGKRPIESGVPTSALAAS